MSTLEANHSTPTRRAPRLWIVESLVVLGVLAFGYFAVAMDPPRIVGSAPVETQLFNPLTELIR